MQHHVVPCPNCQYRLSIRPESLNKRIGCGHCQYTFYLKADLACPGCQRPLQVRRAYLGRRVTCNHCAHAFEAAAGPDPVLTPGEVQVAGVTPAEQVEGLREQVQRFEQALPQLRKELADRPQAPRAWADSPEVTELTDRAQNLAAQLELSAAARQKAEQDLDTLRATVAELRQEYREAARARDQADRRGRELEGEVAHLREQAEEERSRRAVLQRDHQEAIRMVQEQADLLRQVEPRVPEDQAQQMAQLVQWQAEIEATGREIAQREAARQRELDQYRQERDAARKQQEVLARLNEDLGEQAQKLQADLDRLYAAEEERQACLATLEGDLRNAQQALDAERNRASRAAAEVQSRAAAERQQLAAELQKEYEKEREALREELDQLHREVARVRRQRDRAAESPSEEPYTGDTLEMSDTLGQDTLVDSPVPRLDGSHPSRPSEPGRRGLSVLAKVGRIWSAPPQADEDSSHQLQRRLEALRTEAVDERVAQEPVQAGGDPGADQPRDG